MPDKTLNITPYKVQEAVHRGFKRMHNFRSARLMFLRSYTGPYYDREKGEIGAESLNLIFNAIRVLVPHIVMQTPKHSVTSAFLASKDYAQLLTLALDYHSKVNDIKSVYRRAIVDAIFTLGIVKTGLAESDTVYAFNESDRVDTGTIFTEAVDFDNFVVDPGSKDHMFRDAKFMGDKICVPRSRLLDSGLYKNDLVEKLPCAGERYSGDNDRASDLSMRGIEQQDNYDLEDEVEIVELWVPEAKSIITVPANCDSSFKDYLRVDDYYGPDTGPYTLLALTPPVPGNPLPVPSVGVWHDLHVLANRMAKKIISQAERQKDVLAYRPANADDAAELRDAADGESIKVQDPSAVNVLKFGGQEQSNEVQLAQLQNWFNMLSANPQAIGGQALDSDSATEAKILQGNASIGMEDMKDLVYGFGSEEARKRAWFLHTDPFIQLPLIRRDQIPAQMAMGPAGPIVLQGPRIQESQVFLTPEARRGDWLDFTFSIVTESMGRNDASTRLRVGIDFATKVLPAVVAAAQQMLMLGMPFDAKAYLIRLAKDAGIDWLEDVFYDPEFQRKMAMMMMKGPSPEASKGKAGGAPAPSEPNMMDAILQNGQPGQVMGGFPTQNQQFNQQSQAGAVPGQQMVQSGY